MENDASEEENKIRKTLESSRVQQKSKNQKAQNSHEHEMMHNEILSLPFNVFYIAGWEDCSRKEKQFSYNFASLRMKRTLFAQSGKNKTQEANLLPCPIFLSIKSSFLLLFFLNFQTQTSINENFIVLELGSRIHHVHPSPYKWHSIKFIYWISMRNNFVSMRYKLLEPTWANSIDFISKDLSF